MIPIRIKFDARYQQFKLEEFPDGFLLEGGEYEEGKFEEGEDYYLVTEDPSIDLGAEDFDLITDEFDDISLTDEDS